MLIDPNACQWQQKKKILDELYQISDLPVTAPTADRDKLKSGFLDYIFEQSFDALHGGLMLRDAASLSKMELFYKPIATNIIVCECLIAAALVFYEGEFLLIAEKIISMFCERLESENYYLLNDISFTQKELTSNFSSQDIQRILDKDEIALLDALRNNGAFSNVQPVSIEYHCSLKNAAEKIDMHYKQAQIVEHSLLEKLKSNTVRNKISKYSTLLTNPLDINCDMIVTLTNFTLYSPRSNKFAIAEKIYKQVFRQTNQQELQFFELCNLIHAGIILLQLDFKIEIFQTIIAMTPKFYTFYEKQKQQNKESSKIIYQVDFISSFFAKTKKALDNRKLAGVSFMRSHHENQFSFTFMNSKSVDLDTEITSHRSKFDPNHLIFVVDPSYLSTHALE